MGKKQHQKDKLYLTSTEWSTLYGGHKGTSSEIGKRAQFRRLPFHCCSLSMQPFEHPYCTENGTIFDLVNIVPFLKKFGLNPVDGKKLSAKDLVKLNFFKNTGSDKYHCPVTFKVFTENTHIVAVKTTGNVFAFEAIERLNIKPSFWKDLLTDEPFTRKDLITIQDPDNLEKFNFASFYHLKKNLKLNDEEERAKKDAKYHLKKINAETSDILAELEKEYKAPEKTKVVKKRADLVNAAHYSTGRVAASFTSTAMVPETEHEAAIIDEDILRYERIKKKAYLRLHTNKGTINLELHSDIVPKTCENFLRHCKNGYYNDTVFHRSIRNFMIQGGDPTGTGKGGESIWGKPFKDEIKTNLTHTGRGVLSMANSGPDTNKSQFFITFRSARHLDGKHTVFGRLVGGLDVLTALEKVPTDKLDKPKEELKVTGAQVFVDPYEEVEELLQEERVKAESDQAAQIEAAKPKRVSVKEAAPRTFSSGVGKYINMAAQKRDASESLGGIIAESKKKKEKTSFGFGNFSAW